ncbi:MAG: pyridoxal phosphate-dependent aminotransferase family protein [Desulfobaccales bacterium]
MSHPILTDRCRPFTQYLGLVKALGLYPYFRPLSRAFGPEVEVNGRRLVMIGSNDYLGFSHDPRVQEAAAAALRRWGTGPGGSRFLCGNLTLHEDLEARLAHFVGKKHALVHATGFSTNLGALACLLTPKDLIFCDRENHASIFEGCHASRGRLIPFLHNDVEDAARKIAAAKEKRPAGSLMMLLTEGVFSMSGDLAPLAELVRLKDTYPDLLIYLDDAHGLGVMGPGGRGTAMHFGVTDQVDFIMGTFSKALASVGGFIAGDDDDIFVYLKHHSKTLIFSAGLPASCAAAVLACLDLIEREPERIERLWALTRRAHAGYQEIGLVTGDGRTPVIPIVIGDEEKAARVAADLFENGVFALPAVFPAVPRGRAVIRTAFMSTHEERQVDIVLEVLAGVADRHRIRATDLAEQGGGLALARQQTPF